MTIKTTGQLKFSDIEAEFKQGTNPIKLSEYYRGGPEVPDGPTANANIAKTGQQQLHNYYGATEAAPFDPDHDVIHDDLVNDPNAYYYTASQENTNQFVDTYMTPAAASPAQKALCSAI